MKRSDKEQLVVELKEKLVGAQALYFTDFTGMSVKRMTDLRRRLRKAGVEPVLTTPEEFSREIQDDYRMWADVIAKAGIQKK